MSESNEGSAWFWKIFGGTILGMITFLLLAHINNIHNSIDKAKNEGMVAVSLLRDELSKQKTLTDSVKDRILSLESDPYKSRIDVLDLSLKSLDETIKSRNERLAGLETSVLYFKKETEMLQKSNEKLQEQIMALRDRVLAVEQKNEKLRGDQ